MQSNMKKTILTFGDLNAPLNKIMYELKPDQVMKPSEVDLNNIVLSDDVAFSAQGGRFNYVRIFVGYKRNDSVTSLCIKFPKMQTYGVQQYDSKSKFKVCLIREPKGGNEKVDAFVAILEAIDQHVCDLIKQHPCNRQTSPYNMLRDVEFNKLVKESTIPTTLQQFTKYDGGTTIRTVTTPFFNKHKKPVNIEDYGDKRLSLIGVVKFRDIYLMAGRVPDKTLEMCQALIAGVSIAPARPLAFDIDDDELSEDEEAPRFLPCRAD